MKHLFVLGALLALLAPAIARAQTPTLSHDGSVTIVEQNDPNAALVGAELALPAGLDRQRLDQSGLAALTAASIVRTPVDGVPLDDALAAHGGSVRFSVEPSGVRFYIEAYAPDADAVFTLFARALAAPDFSSATMSEARERLVSDIAQVQQEPLAVGIEMLALEQAGGNNVGQPVFGTPASLMELGPADAAAFYRSYYRRGGSSLSIAGRADAIGDATLHELAETLPVGASTVVDTGLHQLGASGQRQLVARRDVSAPWLVVSYDAPSVKSADYGPMLVLAAFLQRTLGDIAEVPGTITPTPASQAVGAVYDYDSAMPSLVLYVDGGIGEPSRTFGTALSVVGILSATRLEGSITQFKRIAASNFVVEASTLETRARLAGVFARRTGSADYLDATLRSIDATTPADLQRVARRYLGKPTIALVLPRITQQN